MDENQNWLSQERQLERELGESEMSLASAEQLAAGAGIMCHNCGAPNEPGAVYCEQCGALLQDLHCPICGAPLDESVDYCERCHHYIDKNHCSFCHALVSPEDTFCPECGASLSGIECPVCHTLGHFGFCEACGTPLTDSARQTLQEEWADSALKERIHELEKELERLWLVKPVTSDMQKEKVQAVANLEMRVKELIAKELQKASAETGTPAPAPASPAPQVEVVTEEELQHKLEDTRQTLQALLDSMETTPHQNPAHARNVAMARKPHVSRLAWKCNYKHALHTSPLGCACPQRGGKWVILDGNSVVKDD